MANPAISTSGDALLDLFWLFWFCWLVNWARLASRLLTCFLLLAWLMLAS
jgi:hypothetical protein